MTIRLQAVSIREDERVKGDQRRYPRVTCEYLTEFQDSDATQVIKGTVVDMSQGGMRIRTQGPVKIANRDDLRFWVWINGSLLKMSGSVVRQVEDTLQVRFDTAGETLRGRLARVVDDTAYRNREITVKELVYPDLARPGKRGNVARALLLTRRGGLSVAEGLVEVMDRHTDASEKWLDRRVATHL